MRHKETYRRASHRSIHEKTDARWLLQTALRTIRDPKALAIPLAFWPTFELFWNLDYSFQPPVKSIPQTGLRGARLADLERGCAQRSSVDFMTFAGKLTKPLPRFVSALRPSASVATPLNRQSPSLATVHAE